MRRPGEAVLGAVRGEGDAVLPALPAQQVVRQAAERLGDHVVVHRDDARVRPDDRVAQQEDGPPVRYVSGRGPGAGMRLFRDRAAAKVAVAERDRGDGHLRRMDVGQPFHPLLPAGARLQQRLQGGERRDAVHGRGGGHEECYPAIAAPGWKCA